MARGARRPPPDWTLPRKALAAAFTARTKMIVLNSPMNPAGKVFTTDELAFIAELVIAHDAIAVCDEVYEHLIFGDARHVPLMTLPGMRDRALRIGSAGKTFSLTGWKVGYISGAAALLRPIAKAHQFVTFTTAPGLQHAIAPGLGLDRPDFVGLGGHPRPAPPPGSPRSACRSCRAGAPASSARTSPRGCAPRRTTSRSASASSSMPASS